MVLALAIPALGSLAAEPLMGILDTALIGRLGSTELAALGAANALFGLLAASLIFLEYGTTARLAQRFGAGRFDLLAHEGMQMAWLGTILGILLTGVLFFFPENLLRWVNVPEEVVAPATLYLRIRATGALPSLWLRVLHGVFRAIQDTKTPLYVVIGMNLLNAILDLVLIFGIPALGLPAFGIAGAAWATVISGWTGAVFLYAAFRPKRREHGIFSPKGRRPEWRTLRAMTQLSSDLLLRSLGLQAALFTGTRMAATFGTAALAGHQVAWQLWIFLALILDSLAIAAQALVGRLLGENSLNSAQALGDRLCRWSLGVGVVFASIFLALRSVLPGLFSNAPDVLAAIDSIFVFIAIMQIPNALLFVLDGLLIGASDMGFLRNSMISLGLFGAFCAWGGGHWFGDLRGVWIGISVFMVARTLVMAWRWFKKGWQTKARLGLGN